MPFIGRYYHALEQKGRLSIPKTFRNQLGELAVLTQGLDGCLFLFSHDSWQTVIAEYTNLPFTQKAARDWVRLLANNAVEVSFDRLGRINIPDYLQQYAQLKSSVVVAGSLSRIEIWDRERYHTYLDDLQARAEEIAEQITNHQLPIINHQQDSALDIK